MFRQRRLYNQPEVLLADETTHTGRRVHKDLTTVDWMHDVAKDGARRKHIQETRAQGWRGTLALLYDASQAWIIVTAIGICAGLFAASIDIVSEWLNDLKFGYCRDAWYLNKAFCCWERLSSECTGSHWIPWSISAGLEATKGQSISGYVLNYFLYVFFAVAFATVAGILVQTFAPFAAGSGIPEVKTILSGFIIRKFLGVWTLWIKGIGLALSVGSGLSLGKEGPMVHLSCCLGNIIPRFFEKYAKNEGKKREILSAASSAGVSVAFGAPVGGVLFALEEVSYYFPYKTLWRSFFCAMVGAVTLQILNPFRTNQLVQLQVRYNRNWHAFELIWFLLLGVFGGVFGAMFTRLNLRIRRWREASTVKHWPIVEVMVVTLLTAVFGYMNDFTRINLGQLVAHLFRECEETDYHGLCDPSLRLHIVLSLLLVVVTKTVFTLFTFGIKVPAGIFIPSMAVGASFGRVVGIFVQWLHLQFPTSAYFSVCTTVVGNCVTPGTYAMVGAAAALAGVTRMTVSLVVIMFELTGALTYILPVMIAVMVAKWVGDALEPEGIYDGLIRMNMYPYLDGREVYRGNATVREIMTDKLAVVQVHGMTVGELETLLSAYQVTGFPVVSGPLNKFVFGFIGKAELEFALEDAKRSGNVNVDTICSFVPSTGVRTETPWPHEQPDSILLSLANSRSTSAAPSPVGGASRPLDLNQWMDQTPLMLSPRLPVAIVLEMFRKVGLRYVLLYENARLEGILTKKDLLEHVHQVEQMH